MKLLTALAFLTSVSAFAALDSTRVHKAEPKKTEVYVREGLVVGGDRAITDATVKDLRRATNAGYERIVLDLESAGMPFYQVALEPESKRIVVTLHGRSRLGLNAPKIHTLFRKSPLVSKVELFPRVDDESWSFALHLKSAVPVEVFELRSPNRVILDLKTAGPMTRAAAPKMGTATYEHATFESDSAPE